ncbi:MAG: hydroxyacid dehydrogenase [Bacteroidota bacterium]
MEHLPKIFISEPINAKGMRMLKDKAELIHASDTSKETAMRLIQDADAVILRATTIFDKEVIEKGTRLQIIARTGVGIDNVDLKAAGERDILVCNTPGTNDDTVAEHVLAIILALAKQLVTMDKAVREQNWFERFSPRQFDIKDKKIGLIGYGRIGKATAIKCKNLGMQVYVYDPYVLPDDNRVHYVEHLDELFSTCDFVSLHCPSLPSTRNMVNARTLALMKEHAYLINTSRGELIDEADLVVCLKAKQIAGAALDVFKNEPLPLSHPFHQLDNLLLSPHVAGSTKESNERIAVAAVQAVLDTLAGKLPENICNGQFLKSTIIS